MELQYLGGNCLKIKTKDATLVVDDNLSQLGKKSVAGPEIIAIFTSEQKSLNSNPKMVIDTPGEYEISGVSIQGIAAKPLSEDSSNGVIYKVLHSEIKLAIVGNVHSHLSDEQIADIDGVDVLFLPIGGDDKSTLGPVGATEIIKKIEPKAVIVSYFEDKTIKYPQKLLSLDEALEKMSLKVEEKIAKYKPKPTDFGESLKVIQLEIS